MSSIDLSKILRIIELIITYLPIDGELPQARIQMMIDDSKIKLDAQRRKSHNNIFIYVGEFLV